MAAGELNPEATIVKTIMAAVAICATAVCVSPGSAYADDQSYQAGYAFVTHQPGLFTDSEDQSPDSSCRYELKRTW
jgi:hypothetical protein